jgi:hypothetical protein
LEKPAATTFVAIESVLRGGRVDERDEVFRARVQIFDVEHAFRQSAEKARGAVLQNVAAWAQQAGVGRQHLAQVDEIILVAPCAVRAGAMSVGRPRSAGGNGGRTSAR